jgi:hypothetical protein
VLKTQNDAGGFAMTGRQHFAPQRFMPTVLVAAALSLVGLSASHAAAASSSSPGVVNGIPCNDLCKAYMAWSDRMMTQFGPSRPHPHARLRTAAHPKRPERTAHHIDVAETRRSGLNSFAQLRPQSSAAPQSAEPQAEMAPMQPTGLPADPFSPTAGALAEQHADAGSAAAEFPETTSVSAADPIAAAQQPGTTGHHILGEAPMQLPLSLVLALCALLAFGSWGWIKGRTQAADAIR